jgi:hypothetical protein
VDPQPGLDYCFEGFYRWSINAIAWTYNMSSKYGSRIPQFDEVAVSSGWPVRMPPHRAGIVGEALFAHAQVCGACK